MSVLMKIRVGDHASDVLAVEIVVGHVDIPGAPVGVVVAVGARTEGAIIPQGWRTPMVLIMAKRKYIFNQNLNTVKNIILYIYHSLLL